METGWEKARGWIVFILIVIALYAIAIASGGSDSSYDEECMDSYHAAIC